MAVIWQSPIADSDSEPESENAHTETTGTDSSQAPETSYSSDQSLEYSPSSCTPNRAKKRRREPELFPKDLQLIGPATFTLRGQCYQMPKFRFVRPDGDITNDLSIGDLFAMENQQQNGKKRPMAARPAVTKSTVPTRSFDRPMIRYRNSRAERPPPIAPDGRRYCPECSAEVRPQMCGGKQLRWRCIGKHHRKWYDVVHEGQVLPNKVRRFPATPPRAGRVPTFTPVIPESFVARPQVPQVRENVDLIWPKLSSKSSDQPSSSNNNPPQSMDTQPSRAPMTRFNHYWLDHKPMMVPTPPPPSQVQSQPSFLSSMLQLSVTFTTIGNALKDASEAQKQDPGSVGVGGTLDLIMDTLMSSMGPLCAAASGTAGVNVDKKTRDRLWNISASHMPIRR